MKTNTLFQNLCKSVNQYHSRPLFYTSPTAYISYSGFMNEVMEYQKFLQTKNVTKGDKIMIIGNNSVKWAIIAYATWAQGAIIVPTYKTQQLGIKKHIMNETQPKLILNTGASLNHHNEINYETFTLGNSSGNSSHSSVKDIDVNKDDIATILYTSGTSSMPKGVVLTHENIITNLESINRITMKSEITHYDKYLSFLPWDHCYGLNCELNYIISIGASTHVVTDFTKLNKNLLEYNPSILCAVPKLFQVIHKKINKLDYLPKVIHPIIRSKVFGKNIRFSTCGGSKIDSKLINFFGNMGLDIFQGYGSTECSPMISLNTVDSNKIGSVGKLLDCNSVKIIDDEIYVSGSNVTSGYFNNKNDPSFVLLNGQKWFRTGDIGYFENNYLHITGRITEQYKLSNGVFVDPTTIEQVLLEIPDISQVMVFGHDQEYNSAIIVTNSDESKIRNQIQKISHKLKTHEIPKKIIITKVPFTVENGTLTQKQSMRRNEIMKKLKD